MDAKKQWWFRLSSVVGLAGLLVTLMAFGGRAHWSLELLSNLRVQMAVGLLAVVLLTALCKNARALAIAVLALVINLACVWPYLWPGATPNRPTAPQLSLMQFNMFYMNFGHDRFFQAVLAHKPDVLALEEVELHWVEALKDNAAIQKRYPYQYFVEDSELAVLSRYPLAQSRALQTISYFRSDKVLLTQIKAPSGVWTLAVIHPNHPTNGFAAWKQRMQVRYLVSAMPAFAQRRFLMAGDFNATPWTYQYQRLVRHLHLKNTRQGYGLQPSWPAPNPAWLMIPIDHVLTSGDVQTTSFAVGPDLGSDHLPVWVGVRGK